MPPSALELFLRRKEQIMGALLEMDADGGGSLQPAELETLIFGRELKEAERADMREGANREQGHSETPPVATPGKEKRSLGRSLVQMLPPFLMEVGRGAIGLGKSK